MTIDYKAKCYKMLQENLIGDFNIKIESINSWYKGTLTTSTGDSFPLDSKDRTENNFWKNYFNNLTERVNNFKKESLNNFLKEASQLTIEDIQSIIDDDTIEPWDLSIPT